MKRRANARNGPALLLCFVGFTWAATTVSACFEPPSDVRNALVVGAALAGGRDPLVAAILFAASTQTGEHTAAASEDALPIDRDVLTGVEDGAPVRSADENYDEARAFNYL